MRKTYDTTVSTQGTFEIEKQVVKNGIFLQKKNKQFE